MAFGLGMITGGLILWGYNPGSACASIVGGLVVIMLTGKSDSNHDVH
jgi:hypothetical protein